MSAGLGEVLVMLCFVVVGLFLDDLLVLLVVLLPYLEERSVGW